MAATTQAIPNRKPLPFWSLFFIAMIAFCNMVFPVHARADAPVFMDNPVATQVIGDQNPVLVVTKDQAISHRRCDCDGGMTASLHKTHFMSDSNHDRSVFEFKAEYEDPGWAHPGFVS